MQQRPANHPVISLLTNPLFLLSCSALLALLVCLVAWAVHTQVFVDATTHQPERFTELYFSDPTQLPTVLSNQVPVPVNFVIRNFEARETDYTFQISFISTNGSAATYGEGKLALAAGGAANITDFINVSGGGQGEVVVQLLDQPESIHFWATVAQ